MLRYFILIYIFLLTNSSLCKSNTIKVIHKPQSKKKNFETDFIDLNVRLRKGSEIKLKRPL